MTLTAAQKDVRLFAALTRAAELGEPCPTCDDLAMLLCTDAVSNTVQTMQRLERQGLIRVTRYQGARVVTIVATGKSTAAPTKRATPHWRESVRAMNEQAA